MMFLVKKIHIAKGYTCVNLIKTIHKQYQKLIIKYMHFKACHVEQITNTRQFTPISNKFTQFYDY